VIDQHGIQPTRSVALHGAADAVVRELRDDAKLGSQII
jgi:hypothetical protein